MQLKLGSAAMSKDVQSHLTPDIKNISLILRVDGIDYAIPVTQAETLWSHEKFNKSLPLALLVTGWTTNYNNTANLVLDTIYNAYRCRGGHNFVVSK